MIDQQHDPYSQSYREARGRFRARAREAGARLEAHPVQGSSDSEASLTIDVAAIGASSPSWSVVVSSGLHGVEGFFGSAIQISCLAQLSAADLQRSGGEFVFIHAINPFGFSELRRVNENNIDLNRNFLLPGEAYAGASAEYAALNGFLNPSAPARLFDPYLARACWTIARVGLPALKQAVAEGQYSYPNGIFFGGHQPARSTAIIRDNMMRWIRGRRVVHLDLHSGLGKYAAYKLLAPASLDAQELAVYRQLFGTETQIAGSDRGIAYRMRGDLGHYVSSMAKSIDYRFLFVEFGTYSPVRVLGALRRENQSHFLMPKDSTARQRAKAALLECFCPASSSWRASVLQQGLLIIERARQAAARE